jgi:hypothetical protein
VRSSSTISAPARSCRPNATGSLTNRCPLSDWPPAPTS